jgi:DNA-binding FrmR family transcriptional regulator
MKMLAGIDGLSRQRFIRLRKRCLDMRGIAHGVSGRTSDGGGRSDEIRAPALNRMLWVFLRLLRSKEALDRFLATTDADAIEANLTELRAREEKLGPDGDPRLIRSITDSIATAEMRLTNYRRSEANAEFVDVELDRIEGKIQALSEMAINHQDPDYISSQVDSVAESVAHTEDAMREMRHITGLTEEMGDAPDILDIEQLEVAG